MSMILYKASILEPNLLWFTGAVHQLWHLIILKKKKNTTATTMQKKISQLIDDISQNNTTCNYLDHVI